MPSTLQASIPFLSSIATIWAFPSSASAMASASPLPMLKSVFQIDATVVHRELGVQSSRLPQHAYVTGLKPKSQFREPAAVEQALLQRLLEADFPGRSELAALWRNVLVRTIHENGGLELEIVFTCINNLS